MEKNSTSSVDRTENGRLSFGGSATQKTTRSNYPPFKVTIFWPRYESARGHYACASYRTQEAGRNTDALA